MALPLYLAMTAAEMTKTSVLPPQLAYMACHFSPYGKALSNCPRQLPGDSLLIVNDVTPIHGHDPERIAHQLEALLHQTRAGAVLLDLQRPGYEDAEVLAGHLAEALPCPVAVSSLYAASLSCPVFLPPVPPDVSLEHYLSPWQSREIWLDAALDAVEITLTASGSETHPLPGPQEVENALHDAHLHCHYRTTLGEDQARFTLFRTSGDLQALLLEAEALGVRRAVGLWQELGGLTVT